MLNCEMKDVILCYAKDYTNDTKLIHIALSEEEAREFCTEKAKALAGSKFNFTNMKLDVHSNGVSVTHYCDPVNSGDTYDYRMFFMYKKGCAKLLIET